MNKKIKVSLLLSSVLFSVSLLSDPLPVTGIWRTINEKGEEESTVEIYEAGGKVYGKIATLKDPNDKDGKPKTCTACKGADKNKPIIGLVFIKGLSVDGDEYANGKILDPNNGTEYSCKIEAIEGGKKLKVRGFLGFSFAGRNQFWLKK
jgi:uncharacterized protein (DUF2147 family)